MWFEISFIAIALLLASQLANAEIVVRDDASQTLRLAALARRIVTVAPHISENLYAAGAGSFIVGAVDYRDYPEAAKQLPRVGGYARLDLEAILALKPDLVIAWESSNAAAHLAKLKTLGLPLSITLYRSDRVRFMVSQRQRRTSTDDWVLSARGARSVAAVRAAQSS